MVKCCQKNVTATGGKPYYHLVSQEPGKQKLVQNLSANNMTPHRRSTHGALTGV